MKAQIITLLETTRKNYAEIALEVGCSEKYVRKLHKDMVDAAYVKLKANRSIAEIFKAQDEANAKLNEYFVNLFETAKANVKKQTPII